MSIKIIHMISLPAIVLVFLISPMTSSTINGQLVLQEDQEKISLDRSQSNIHYRDFGSKSSIETSQNRFNDPSKELIWKKATNINKKRQALDSSIHVIKDSSIDLDSSSQISSPSYAKPPSGFGNLVSLDNYGGGLAALTASLNAAGIDGLNLGFGGSSNYNSLPTFLPDTSIPNNARPPVLSYNPSNTIPFSFLGQNGFGSSFPSFGSQSSLSSLSSNQNLGLNSLPSLTTVLEQGAKAFTPETLQKKINNFDSLRQLATNPLQTAFTSTINDPSMSPLPFPKLEKVKSSLTVQVEKDLKKAEDNLSPDQKVTKNIYESIPGVGNGHKPSTPKQPSLNTADKEKNPPQLSRQNFQAIKSDQKIINAPYVTKIEPMRHSASHFPPTSQVKHPTNNIQNIKPVSNIHSVLSKEPFKTNSNANQEKIKPIVLQDSMFSKERKEYNARPIENKNLSSNLDPMLSLFIDDRPKNYKKSISKSNFPPLHPVASSTPSSNDDKASNSLKQQNLRPLPPKPNFILPKLLSSSELLSFVEKTNPKLVLDSVSQPSSSSKIKKASKTIAKSKYKLGTTLPEIEVPMPNKTHNQFSKSPRNPVLKADPQTNRFRKYSTRRNFNASQKVSLELPDSLLEDYDNLVTTHLPVYLKSNATRTAYINVTNIDNKQKKEKLTEDLIPEENTSEKNSKMRLEKSPFLLSASSNSFFNRKLKPEDGSSIFMDVLTKPKKGSTRSQNEVIMENENTLNSIKTIHLPNQFSRKSLRFKSPFLKAQNNLTDDALIRKDSLFDKLFIIEKPSIIHTDDLELIVPKTPKLTNKTVILDLLKSVEKNSLIIDFPLSITESKSDNVTFNIQDFKQQFPFIVEPLKKSISKNSNDLLDIFNSSTEILNYFNGPEITDLGSVQIFDKLLNETFPEFKLPYDSHVSEVDPMFLSETNNSYWNSLITGLGTKNWTNLDFLQPLKSVKSFNESLVALKNFTPLSLPKLLEEPFNKQIFNTTNLSPNFKEHNIIKNRIINSSSSIPYTQEKGFLDEISSMNISTADSYISPFIKESGIKLIPSATKYESKLSLLSKLGDILSLIPITHTMNESNELNSSYKTNNVPSKTSFDEPLPIFELYSNATALFDAELNPLNKHLSISSPNNDTLYDFESLKISSLTDEKQNSVFISTNLDNTNRKIKEKDVGI